MLAPFLKINGELRAMNNERDRGASPPRRRRRVCGAGRSSSSGTRKSKPRSPTTGPICTRGREVDQQVHLGFDLAVTANVPVVAANSGVVLNASWLGIFGNCVIIDHGMGVQSLYGHLSSFDVKVGDTVTKGQMLGRSGMTGLAGGDHLHFTMLVGGTSGQSGRMVGRPLDSGSGRAEARDAGR